ncbi:MAG: DUF2147 domain-containing protein [Deinococcales bacterium]|nr:DUF2147 domain-containing protein [Chitinophagaceae bacterium]
MKSILLILVSIFFINGAIYAQKDKIEHTWYNEEKTSKIQIYKAPNGVFDGKIVWLIRPLEKDGKIKLDKLNPDDKLKSQTIINSVILKGFTRSKSDTSLYENGTVYSPANGKTYCGVIIHRGKELKLRGYFCGFSILGKSWICPLAE